MENKTLLSMDQLNNVTGGSGQVDHSKTFYIVEYYMNGNRKEIEFSTSAEAYEHIDYLKSCDRVSGIGLITVPPQQ